MIDPLPGRWGGIERERQPYVRPIRMPEHFRHDADDRPRMPVDRNGCADCGRLATELFAPKIITNDGHGRSAWPVFIGGKNKSPRWGQNEGGGKKRVDPGRSGGLWHAIAYCAGRGMFTRGGAPPFQNLR